MSLTLQEILDKRGFVVFGSDVRHRPGEVVQPLDEKAGEERTVVCIGPATPEDMREQQRLAGIPQRTLKGRRYYKAIAE